MPWYGVQPTKTYTKELVAACFKYLLSTCIWLVLDIMAHYRLFGPASTLSSSFKGSDIRFDFHDQGTVASGATDRRCCLNQLLSKHRIASRRQATIAPLAIQHDSLIGRGAPS